MGVHTYPCPTCHSPQKVRAESGEVVEIKDCEACAQTKLALNDGEATDDTLEALDRKARRR